MPLKVSHGIGAWIKDFKGSDAPQFKGRSDKERRDQAIAAYLSAKRAQKEGKEDPPFEGPYKKAGSKPSAVPGKFGIGPSTAKHLAKMGMKKAAEKKPVKESDAAWAAAKEKEKMDRLTPSDQDKIAKIRAMLAKEKKPVKEAKERTSSYKFTHTPGDAESEKKLADLKKHVKDNMPGHRVVLQGRLGKNNPNAHKYSKSAPAAKYDEKGKRTNADVSGKSGAHSHQRIQKADAARHDVYVYRREDVEYMQEETTFEVEVDGLPTMYMKAKSPGAVKAELRKIVKQPSMIQSIERVTDAEMKKVFRDKAQGREDTKEVEEGTSSLKPGWMLKADPKLGAAVKAKQDLAKKRQATYGKPEAGKSVKEEVNEISGELAQRYHDKAVKAPRKADAKDPIGHVLKRFSGMQRAQDRIHRDAMKDINKRASDRLKGM